MGRCHHVDSVVHSIKILLSIAKCQSLSNKLDMLIYCTLKMHVQQATYANELHVNVQHLIVYQGLISSSAWWVASRYLNLNALWLPPLFPNKLCEQMHKGKGI